MNIGRILFIAMALAVSTPVWSLDNSEKKNIDNLQDDRPFLETSEIPDALKILAAPPEEGSEAFQNDIYYYNWGKHMRQDTNRALQAVSDCKCISYDNVGDCFEEAFGIDISPENTPQTCILFKRVLLSVFHTFEGAKEKYRRVRPFVHFAQKSLCEEMGEVETYRDTWSYPSGHSLIAFTLANLLSEINPDAASELTERARIFAENRIICGHHYKSDVDASVLIAGALVSILHSKAEFTQQMDRAKREFIEKSGKKTSSHPDSFNSVVPSGKDFLQLALDRYSVRSFTSEPLEQEQIDKILRAGQVAPTAVNSQPQKIYVVRTPEMMAKMREVSPCMFGAPHCFVFCYNDDTVVPRGKDDNYGEIDVSIVLTHMMLEAADIGVGTCAVGYFDSEKLRDALDLPPSIHPILMMPFGYPSKKAKPSVKHTQYRPIEETVEYR